MITLSVGALIIIVWVSMLVGGGIAAGVLLSIFTKQST